MNKATRSSITTLLSADPTVKPENILAALAVLEDKSPSRSQQPTQHELYTIREAADFFRCSRSTLWRMENDGVLKPVLVRGRKLFRREALEAALTEKAK